eukprot:c26077_g1_i1 orf=777-1064(-)
MYTVVFMKVLLVTFFQVFSQPVEDEDAVKVDVFVMKPRLSSLFQCNNVGGDVIVFVRQESPFYLAKNPRMGLLATSTDITECGKRLRSSLIKKQV